MTHQRSKRDTTNPCIKCGWAEHMAIHAIITSGPRKGEYYDHKYVGRANDDKPPLTAPLFVQAAWFLRDYADLWYEIGPHDDKSEEAETDARCAEMRELARRLDRLVNGWQAKQQKGSAATAAAIISDMLRDGGMPGSVWYYSPTHRWRLAGEGYRAQDGEICVGIYESGATQARLAIDFERVLTEKPMNHK